MAHGCLNQVIEPAKVSKFNFKHRLIVEEDTAMHQLLSTCQTTPSSNEALIFVPGVVIDQAIEERYKSLR